MKFTIRTQIVFDSLTTLIDQALTALAGVLRHFFQRLGRYWSAGFVALFAAFELYHIVLESGQGRVAWAWAFAITGAIAFEALGLNVADTTVYLYHLYRQGHVAEGQYRLARGLVIFYPIIVIATIVSGNTFTGFMKVVGILSPFLAIILYVVRAMHDQALAEMEQRKAHEAEKWEAEKADREARRATDLKQAEFDREVEKQRRADEREAARLRLETELAQEAADREAKRQAMILRAEATAKAKVAQVTQRVPQQFPKFSENGNATENLPEWLPKIPKSLSELRQMVAEGLVVPDGITAREFGNLIGQGERTALNWLKEAYRLQEER